MRCFYLKQYLFLLLLYSLIIITEISHASDNHVIPLVNEALFRQILKGSLEDVDLLLKIGASPNARNKKKETILIWAVKHGRPDVVAFLLEAGADPNAKDSSGHTALMWACRSSDYPSTVEILLKYGADPDIQISANKQQLKLLS